MLDSVRSPAPDPRVLLQRDDLIEDREVADTSGDQLSHAHIAAELAELAELAPDRSNIALYGPWGSGKSGIGNLLRAEIQERKGMQFARFDAFKYAEKPLRRNFISAVAHDAGVENPQFHRDLYLETNTTDVTVPVSRVAKILGLFALLSASLTVILLLVVAGVAGIEHGPFWAEFRRLCKTTVLAGLVPATLLSALITLSSKTFQLERKAGRPDSDEQFEDTFKDLVKNIGARRLVVFVDELDRCDAGEVVATLDAIRTFLGVAGCVFVIAADQRVLEQSLTHHARQETPADAINPYYSTGSAYLDKVFQYQISLPPLLAQRITRYAADQVKDRRGLWAEINSEYVTSVLVPTHIASPRRVKHLLNAFALTYRFAEDRHRRTLLSDPPSEHAAAIAKLVCLRVEFPLFAQELEVDARLPEMVLTLKEDPSFEFPTSYSDLARERAKLYAAGKATATSMIMNDDATENDAGTDDRAVVEHRSNDQLINYLRRTRNVLGLNRDLVHMHSSGTAFGLEGQLTLLVEDAAENGDVAALTRLLDGADNSTREGILRLLDSLLRDRADIGGANTARALLGAYRLDPGLLVAPIADSASHMITFLSQNDATLLTGDDLVTAWQLANVGVDAGAQQLQDAVLNTVVADDLDATFLLAQPRSVMTHNPELLAKLVAGQLVHDDDGPDFTEAFSRIDLSTAAEILLISSARVSSALDEALANRDYYLQQEREWRRKQQQVQTIGGNRTAAPEERWDPQPVIDALVKLGCETAATTSVLGHEIVRVLLPLRWRAATNALASIFAVIDPIEDRELITGVITGTSGVGLAAWPVWLGSIAADIVTAEEHGSAIHALAPMLWTEKDSPENTGGAVAALGAVLQHLPAESKPDLTSTAVADFESPVTTETEVEDRTFALRQAELLADAGFLELQTIHHAALATVPATLQAAPTSADDVSALANFLVKETPALLAKADAEASAIADVRRALEAVHGCQWLPEVAKLEVILTLLDAAGGANDSDSLMTLPDVSFVVDLLETYAIAAAHVTNRWVAAAHPAVPQLAQVLAAVVTAGGVSEETVAAFNAAQKFWSAEERAQFVHRYVGAPDDSELDALTARLIGLDSADESAVVDILAERLANCTNDRQRTAVVGTLKQAKVSSDAVRRQVVDSIVLRLLQPQSPDNRPHRNTTLNALDALANLQPPAPHGTKRKLTDAVRAAVGATPDLETRAIRVLEPFGMVKKGGFLRRDKIKDAHDDSNDKSR